MRRRAQIYKYKKSGRLAAIFHRPAFIGVTLIELSPDMNSILNVRNPKFVKRDKFEPTQYQVELIETRISKEGRVSSFSFEVFRVLSKSDLDVDRWISTEALADLPVSSDDDPTIEELAWAGKREGNLGWGIALVALTLGAIYLAATHFRLGGDFIFYGVVAAIAGIFLARYRWKLPRKPRPDRLEQLRSYKKQLQSDAERSIEGKNLDRVKRSNIKAA